MSHYICTGGCQGVSDKPGVCQTEECSMHGHTLQECGCADGEHDGAFQEEPEENEE